MTNITIDIKPAGASTRSQDKRRPRRSLPIQWMMKRKTRMPHFFPMTREGNPVCELQSFVNVMARLGCHVAGVIIILISAIVDMSSAVASPSTWQTTEASWLPFVAAVGMGFAGLWYFTYYRPTAAMRRAVLPPWTPASATLAFIIVLLVRSPEFGKTSEGDAGGILHQNNSRNGLFDGQRQVGPVTVPFWLIRFAAWFAYIYTLLQETFCSFVIPAGIHFLASMSDKRCARCRPGPRSQSASRVSPTSRSQSPPSPRKLATPKIDLVQLKEIMTEKHRLRTIRQPCKCAQAIMWFANRPTFWFIHWCTHVEVQLVVLGLNCLGRVDPTLGFWLSLVPTGIGLCTSSMLLVDAWGHWIQSRGSGRPGVILCGLDAALLALLAVGLRKCRENGCVDPELLYGDAVGGVSTLALSTVVVQTLLVLTGAAARALDEYVISGRADRLIKAAEQQERILGDDVPWERSDDPYDCSSSDTTDSERGSAPPTPTELDAPNSNFAPPEAWGVENLGVPSPPKVSASSTPSRVSTGTPRGADPVQNEARTQDNGLAPEHAWAQNDGLDPEQDGVRILCLDGGGLRGLISLWMLEFLENVMGDRSWIHSYDLVCGVSAGALVALSLSDLKRWRRPDGGKGMRGAKDVIDVFFAGGVTFAKSVTNLANLVCNLCRLLWTGSLVAESKLEKIYEPYMAGRSFKERPDMPKAFFVCNKVEHGSQTLMPTLITNYKTEGRPELPSEINDFLETVVGEKFEYTTGWSCMDALLAAQGIPVVCPPRQREGEKYIDGAITVNNPVVHAVVEATKLWPDRDIACIHSFGTGGQPMGKSKGSKEGVMGWVLALMAGSNTTEVMDAQARAILPGLRDVKRRVRQKLGLPRRRVKATSMVRLQPPNLGIKYSLFCHDQFEEMHADTAEYCVNKRHLFSRIALDLQSQAPHTRDDHDDIPEIRLNDKAIFQSVTPPARIRHIDRLSRASSKGQWNV